MKAIIDNKIYDTKKAKLLFSYLHKNSFPSMIKGYCHTFWENADIYKTKKGTYFIHFYNDEYPNKARIEIATEDEVKFKIANLDPDKYIKIFGKVEEG